MEAKRDEPNTEKPSSPWRGRVLVVEDNVDTAESLADLISEWGHEVHTAHDGDSAVRLASEKNLDVIFLDIGLPGKNGYEIAQILRSMPATSETFLVALTGYTQQSEKDRARAAGFDMHLVKPIDLEAMEALLLARPKRGQPAVATARRTRL